MKAAFYVLYFWKSNIWQELKYDLAIGFSPYCTPPSRTEFLLIIIIDSLKFYFQKNMDFK